MRIVRPEDQLDSPDELLVPDGWELPKWMRELATEGNFTARNIVRMWDSGESHDRKSAYRRTIKNTKEAGTPVEAKALFIQAGRTGLGRLLQDMSRNTPPTLK
jgi:hypothetical protein